MRGTRAAVRPEGGHEGHEVDGGGKRGVTQRTTLERIQEFRKIQGVWIDPLMKKKGS